MVCVGNRSHRRRHRCLPLHDHRPGHDPQGQHGLGLHRSLGWLLATHHRLFCPSFMSPVPSLFIRLPLFSFSFSPVTTHLYTVVAPTAGGPLGDLCPHCMSWQQWASRWHGGRQVCGHSPPAPSGMALRGLVPGQAGSMSSAPPLCGCLVGL